MRVHSISLLAVSMLQSLILKSSVPALVNKTLQFSFMLLLYTSPQTQSSPSGFHLLPQTAQFPPKLTPPRYKYATLFGERDQFVILQSSKHIWLCTSHRRGHIPLPLAVAYGHAINELPPKVKFLDKTLTL